MIADISIVTLVSKALAIAIWLRFDRRARTLKLQAAIGILTCFRQFLTQNFRPSILFLRHAAFWGRPAPSMNRFITYLCSRLVGTILGVALLLGYAAAADLRKPQTNEVGFCSIVIDGEIEPGDAKRLKQMVAQGGLPPTKMLERAVQGLMPNAVICLNSPGGSYVEGLKLMDLFLAQSLGTAVLSKHECYSACALAFMAGSIREESLVFPFRQLSPAGKLGFHAPYASFNSSLTALQGTAIVSVGNLTTSWLLLNAQKLSIRSSLIANFLRFGPTEFLMIDNLLKAQRWDINVLGKLKQLPTINERSANIACLNVDLYERIDTEGTVGVYADAAQDGSLERWYADISKVKSIKNKQGVRFVVDTFPPEGTGICNLDVVRGANGMSATLTWSYIGDASPAFGKGKSVLPQHFFPAVLPLSSIFVQ